MLYYYLRYARQMRKFVVEDLYLAKDIYFIQFKQQLETMEQQSRKSFATIE
jgi:hypothetical protein